MMLILDTHVLIWLDEGSFRLGISALKQINDSLRSGRLGVSTISFWETAMLVEKGRLSMHTEMEIWREDLLQAGLIEIPLGGAAAIRAGRLAQFRGDPADRMIVATTIENSAELITADEKILSWPQFSHTIDARL